MWWSAMKMATVSVFLLLVSFLQVEAQTTEDELSTPCTKAQSCGECIQTSAICTWCGSENFPRKAQRCDSFDNIKKICPVEDISNPQPSSKTIEDDPWTSGAPGIPPVQVKPQEVQFQIRTNEPTSFTLKFKQQENYPVDLYFLLDISYGMVRQKEAQQRLIALGQEITEKMKTITNNFRLGFGTFVDKPVMPYSAWTDRMMRDRCPEKSGCRQPHGFKNEMNLSDSGQDFAVQMKQALSDISLSLDDTEGGLDGLIQALDCNRIGWRDVSRKIIVYSSNSLFHLAGSGLLGGATKQNDLNCALDNNGFYEHDKLYDYPSMSQIASKLREKKTNVIFAVMSNVTSYYELLRSFLDGAVVGELEEDSANIVELISEKYYELRSRIKFQARQDDNVDISFKSKCKGAVVRETSICDNLGLKDEVEFNVTMTVSSDICEGRLDSTVDKEVIVDAVGLNEQLVVKLQVQCGCECESRAEDPAIPRCTKGNGTFECGICYCNEGRYGRECECDASEVTSEKSIERCRINENSTTCSGNGECICGVCNCFPLAASFNERYSGLYCECNDYSCPRGPNGLCGGPTQGKCDCGKCKCLTGWSGNDCECSTDTSLCVASNGEICNGAGTCQCGRCKCNPDTSMAGPTCEDCPTCSSQCSEYIDCAQCTAYGSGNLNKEECKKLCECTTTCPIVEVKDTLEYGEGIRECLGIDVDSCKFVFTYEYTKDNRVKIKAQKTKSCPEEAPIAAIVGGTVAAVVLIPLLLICLLIFIRNRRDAKEYAAFLKDRSNAEWDKGANPIYKGPKSTFQNPTYTDNE